MKKRILMVALLAGLVSSMQARAHHQADELHIYGTGWGITLADDGTGFYNDFIAFLLGQEQAKNKYMVWPYRRTMRAFLADPDSCVYPKSIDALYRTGDWGKDDHFIESTGLLKSPIHIFTPEGKPVLHDNEALSGLRIAYAMGSKITHSIRVKNVTFIPVADEVDKAKLLSTGTVDAIVANLPDAKFVFESLGRRLPPYDPEYEPIPVPFIRIVCHDTPANRAFMLDFDAHIDDLVSSGAMAAFLRQHGLKAEQYLP